LTLLLLAVVGVVEVQSLTELFRAHARLVDRATESARQALVQARPQIEGSLAPGDPATLRRGVEVALNVTGASEGALFDPSGRPLAAFPSAQVLPSLSRDDLRDITDGNVFARPAILSTPSRVISCAAFVVGGNRVVLKLATAVPDVVADLRDRQKALAGRALALISLVLAAVLCLAPGRTEWAPPSPRALEAYVEAMGRLGERGRALSIQRAAERQQMAEREALARAGELTSGIVHELRNGLGTILGYARLLERTQDPQAVEAGRAILDECETLRVVIRRFLDFVRTESLNPAAFDIKAMLSRVVAREGRKAPDTTISVSNGDVGNLLGDEELLERAFENLVRNALEAAGPSGHVWIDLGREEDRLVVSIADDGPGLKGTEADRMRPFFTTKPGGLGLGLPITHKIVSLHHGQLFFDDREPRGLVVRILLPVDVSGAHVTNSSGQQPRTTPIQD
jgi:signal transduction histidine kinase